MAWMSRRLLHWWMRKRQDFLMSWADWPGYATGLSRSTLRFKSQGMEAGFVRQRIPRLMNSASLFAIIGVFLAGGIVLYDVFFTQKLVPDHYQYDDFIGAQVQFYSFCAMIGVGLVTSAVCRCQYLVKRVRPLAWEISLAILMTLGMYAVVLTMPIVVCTFGGFRTDHHPDGTCTWGAGSSSGLLILGVVTLSHFGLPIRWHVVVFMEVMGFLLYGMLVFVICPQAEGAMNDEYTSIYNTALLFGILCATSVGKRHAELGERTAFANILNERSLRCEAEFKLAQAPAVGPRHRGDDEASVARSRSESLPTTTGTGLVFEDLYKDGCDTSAKLTEIAAIGDAEHWRISPSEVQLLPEQCLGAGGFGVVYKGTFCGSFVAVKLPRGKIEDAAAKRLPELCNELRVLRRLRHPNIVTVHGAVIDPERMRIALVLELIQGQRLDHFLEGSKDNEDNFARHESMIDNFARYQIMIGVIRALWYMHTRSPPTIHGDIKHSNILVEAQGKPRLLDFGLSRVLARRSSPLGGTLAWMPPELTRDRDATLKKSADIYTFGRLIAYVATGIKPMSELSARAIRKALRRGTPPLPTWPRGCLFEPVCRPLAEKCLTSEAGCRPSAASVLMELLLPDALGIQDSESDFFRDQGARIVGLESAFVEQCSAPNSQRGGTPAPPVGASPVPAAGSPEPNPDPAPPWPQMPRASELNDSLPALPEAAPLDCDSGGGLAPESSEQKILTTNHAKLLTLCDTIARWNAEVPQDACCVFHGEVSVVQEVVDQLRGLECRPDKLMRLDGKQCPRCGILGMEFQQTQCEICSEVL